MLGAPVPVLSRAAYRLIPSPLDRSTFHLSPSCASYIWITGRVDDVLNVSIAGPPSPFFPYHPPHFTHLSPTPPTYHPLCPLLPPSSPLLQVSGHRLGTAEIESALVTHPACVEAAVIGIPHDIKGQVSTPPSFPLSPSPHPLLPPVPQGVFAYCILKEGAEETADLVPSLKAAVRSQIGGNMMPPHIPPYLLLASPPLASLRLLSAPHTSCLTCTAGLATPDMLVCTPGLPKTRSGKIMRRVLRKIACRESDQLGDVSTLADPSIVRTLVSKVEALYEAVKK